jgi:hypothetical protein
LELPGRAARAVTCRGHVQSIEWSCGFNGDDSRRPSDWHHRSRVQRVSAAFKVLNVHFIAATVPAGATSGSITVTNRGGATTSTQHFTVQ